jgi:hypothetical protein
MTPQEAYETAYYTRSTVETRRIACEDAYYAYKYALHVDEAPRDDTRAAAAKDPFYAIYYARGVDRGPHDLTREAASRDPWWKLQYEVFFPVTGS